MSVNRIVLIGNLGKDPEVKELANGKVATFSLATTEKGYTMQNGTVRPDVTSWHSIVVWGKLADVVQNYCKKGSQIYCEGKLTYRQWEKDGHKHTSAEIVCERLELLGSRNSEKPNDEKPSEKADDFVSAPPKSGDDLPF